MGRAKALPISTLLWGTLLQEVTYSSTSNLSCSCTLPADVILCVTPSLVAPPPPPPEGIAIGVEPFDFTGIPATLIAVSTANCINTYTFEYNDDYLADGAEALVPGDIEGVQCIGCRELWLMGLIAAKSICFVDSDTIEFTELESGCVTAEAVGGEGANDWHITGNADIVDGTNFLGTTNSSHVDIRVNNIRVQRYQIGSTASNDTPCLIGGCSHNFIDGEGVDAESNVICGGGISALFPNFMQDNGSGGSQQCGILSGLDNGIIDACFASGIGVGNNNRIKHFDAHSGIFSGVSNTIEHSSDVSRESKDNFIGGGSQGVETDCSYSFIGSGWENEINFGHAATISGGYGNSIDFSTWVGGSQPWQGDTIGGGTVNTIVINSSFVPYGPVAVPGQGNLEITGNGIFTGVQNRITNSKMSLIGGGYSHVISNGTFDVIAGGEDHTIQKDDSTAHTWNFIGGGHGNVISGDGCVIVGGGTDAGFTLDRNSIHRGFFSTVGGGGGNRINPDAATAISGLNAGYSTIAGGKENRVNEVAQVIWTLLGYCTISGGDTNQIFSTDFATIGGGANNYVQYLPADVILTNGNHAQGDTVSGGMQNGAYWSDDVAGTIATYLGLNTISGGWTNETVNSIFGTVSGGVSNTIDSADITAAWSRLSLGPWNSNTISGGYFNHVFDSVRSSIQGGGGNVVWGNDGAFIAGGYLNLINNTAAVPAITSTSIFTTTTDPPDDPGIGNTIFCGEANQLLDGKCAAIGGAFLKAAGSVFGFQSAATRTFTALDSASRNFSVVGNRSIAQQVDISAFSGLAYFGDTDLWVANTDNDARKLKLLEPNTDTDFSSTHYSSLEAQAQGANIEYVMPAAAGIAGNSLKIQSVVGTVVTLEWA